MPKITKKSVKKTVVKPVHKPAAVKIVKKPSAIVEAQMTKQESAAPLDHVSMTVHVVDTQGVSAGSLSLPKELFGAKVNKKLIAQAIRVYQANQRVGHAATKTRGQVEGSTRKIYKQKGTGKARHGGIRAPIFVGGGIVFGPTPRDYSKDMPKKMKTQALASALSMKYGMGGMIFVDGLENLTPKTKNIVQSMGNIKAGKNILFVVASASEKLVRASRNIAHMDIVRAIDLHPYSILSHHTIVFTKHAVAEAKERFI
jgi:large subunit ribosomal protein L4